MMTLDNMRLIDLQPEFLRDDPTTVALCDAFQPIFALLGSEIKGILLYTNIDTLGGDVLDEIAWGLNIAWYDAGETLAARRETVKNALRVYRTMGTAAAVKRAVSAYFGEAEVEEWFDYDGEPGMFRVRVTDETATTGRALEFLNVVDQVKNVRSHLERIILATISPAPFRVGTVTSITRRVRSEQIG